MYLDSPPLLIETKVFSAMPDQFRRKGARSTWADANRPGQPTDCFIEGPSFDANGNLYIVDIPFGRQGRPLLFDVRHQRSGRLNHG
jgi:gluconolactonase